MPIAGELQSQPTMASSPHSSPNTESVVVKHPDPHVVGKFLSAGLAASFAEAVTIPIDTAKVRLQVQGEHSVMSNVAGGSTTASAGVRYRGMIGTIMTIGKNEGVKSLYNGLIPGIHRQMMFCGIRIGLYDHVKRFLGDKDEEHPKVLTKILASCITGMMAVSCAHPTEVVKVRFQANASRYQKGVMNAYATIFRKEGIRGLWKGAYANMARLCTVNCSELVVYDILKGFILRHKFLADEFPCHFVSAFGAGFAATVIASPVDVVKTRYMNSPPNTYKSGFNCAYMMLKHNGPTAFYKGFTPNFMRLGMWNIVMFVSYEQLKRAFYKAEHYWD